MKLINPTACSVAMLCIGASRAHAQDSWTPLSMPGTTKLWADSKSWLRRPDGTISVRMRTVEARVDGKPSEGGTVQYLDFDCARKVYRLRRTEFVKGDKVAAILPDSIGSHGWQAPNTGWLEDLQLQAACKNAPTGSRVL